MHNVAKSLIAADLSKGGLALRHPVIKPQLQSILGTPALAPKSVALLCAEPFCQDCEGQACDAQLWQHWAQVDALRPFLASAAILVPCGFRLQAALLSCPQLWRRRQPFEKALCIGVDVSAINRLHSDPLQAAGSPAGFRDRFPCALWQVEHRIVSDPVALCHVQLQSNFPRKVQHFEKVVLAPHKEAASTLGIHAIVTWTEVELSCGTFRSTSRLLDAKFHPGHELQGVLLASRPALGTSEVHGPVQVQPRFDPRSGSFSLKANWEGFAF